RLAGDAGALAAAGRRAARVRKPPWRWPARFDAGPRARPRAPPRSLGERPCRGPALPVLVQPVAAPGRAAVPPGPGTRLRRHRARHASARAPQLRRGVAAGATPQPGHAAGLSLRLRPSAQGENRHARETIAIRAAP